MASGARSRLLSSTPYLSSSGKCRFNQPKHALVSLSDHIHKFPSDLSSGMKQRGQLARDLVMDPEMLLMDANNDDRRRVAMRYLRGLSNTALTLALPVTRDWAEPVWHLFVVWSGERDTLRWRLSPQGIETLIHYPTSPRQQAAYLGGVPGGWSLAEALAAEALSLRIWPGMAEADVDQVITPCLAAP